jgi:membrane protein DedA with SNARE-associated domain
LITELETIILSAAQTIYDAWGWFGVAILLTFENATGITPSEIILGLAGWMLISEHQLPVSMIFVGGLYAAIGSTLGASITYWVARIGGRPVIDKFVKFFRLDPSLIAKSEEQMHKWGTGLVLIGRVIPGIRTLVSIPAGLAKIPFIKFFFATFIGPYIWCTLLIGAGYILGHEWMLVSGYIKQHLPFVDALGLFAIGAYLIFKHRRRILALTWTKTKKMDQNEL